MSCSSAAKRSASAGGLSQRMRAMRGSGLDGYYRQNVIGGVNAFVAIASGFETFGRSLVAKLIQEIS